MVPYRGRRTLAGGRRGGDDREYPARPSCGDVLVCARHRSCRAGTSLDFVSPAALASLLRVGTRLRPLLPLHRGQLGLPGHECLGRFVAPGRSTRDASPELDLYVAERPRSACAPRAAVRRDARAHHRPAAAGLPTAAGGGPQTPVPAPEDREGPPSAARSPRVRNPATGPVAPTPWDTA